MASQNWFQHGLVAWAWPRFLVCLSVALFTQLRFKILSSLSFPEGLFYCTFEIFFSLHKVLTHVVMAVCWLSHSTMSMLVSISKQNRPGGPVHTFLNFIMRLLCCQMHIPCYGQAGIK